MIVALRQCAVIAAGNLHGIAVARTGKAGLPAGFALLQQFNNTALFIKAQLFKSQLQQADRFKIMHQRFGGQRQPCADFPRFAPLFTAFHDGLKSGAFGLERFTHKLKIAAGDFFILNGLLGYVDSVGERLEQYSGYNARLYLVFENGTEMHMLYQSLTHGLVRDKEGRKVQTTGQSLLPSLETVPSGIVYILKTLSTDPTLVPYRQNLYKIGFTETSVEERIKNAEMDSTFLEAPVQIVAINQCFNLNAQKLEALVHGFFAPRRLNVKLKSYSGQIYTPKEWFNVPLESALAVIQFIVDGSISQYRLDNTTGKVLPKIQ